MNYLFSYAYLLIRNDNAATAIEYALIAAGIALAIVVTVSVVGTTLTTEYYQKLADAF